MLEGGASMTHKPKHLKDRPGHQPGFPPHLKISVGNYDMLQK